VPKVAAILPVIESCRRLETNPRKYLAAILPGLASKSVPSLKQRERFVKPILSSV
jgi:hypothetical protein